MAHADLKAFQVRQHADPSALPPVISLTKDPAHPRLFVHTFDLTAELSSASTNAERQESTFWNIHSSITVPGGGSFESTSLPGYYLRQRFGRAVLCHERLAIEFRQSATFRWRPGFSNSQGVSLEPVSVLGNYLVVPPTGKGAPGPTPIGARPWPLLTFDSRPTSPADTTKWDSNATFYAAAPLSDPRAVSEVQAPSSDTTNKVCTP
jgi:hypothetical protein